MKSRGKEGRTAGGRSVGRKDKEQGEGGVKSRRKEG